MDQPIRQSESEDARKNVLAVYVYLVFGLLVSAVTCLASYRVGSVVFAVREHFIITMLVTSALLTVLLGVFNKIPYPDQKLSKISVWVVICFVSGVPLVEFYPGVLLKSAVITVILVVFLTLISFPIPRNLVNFFVTPLSILHSVVLVCTIYSLLVSPSNTAFYRLVNSICMYGGFIVYSTLLVCNTQRLGTFSKYRRFDPIFTTVIMFINIVNLVSRVAALYSVGVVDC